MLNIIYQDESIVVCEKPFRVLSTDEPGGMPDLIREAIGQPEAKVRSVHRLDQVVGGIMVYALTGPTGMRSRTMSLNGKELVLGENDELPQMTGVTMEGSVEVAPGSCVFFVM